MAGWLEPDSGCNPKKLLDKSRIWGLHFNRGPLHLDLKLIRLLTSISRPFFLSASKLLAKSSLIRRSLNLRLQPLLPHLHFVRKQRTILVVFN